MKVGDKEFNIGDKVARINSDNGGCKIGQIGTIIRFSGSDVYLDIAPTLAHSVCNLALVSGEKVKNVHPKYLAIDECGKLTLVNNLKDVKETSKIYKLTPLKRLVKTMVMREEKLK